MTDREKEGVRARQGSNDLLPILIPPRGRIVPSPQTRARAKGITTLREMATKKREATLACQLKDPRWTYARLREIF